MTDWPPTVPPNREIREGDPTPADNVNSEALGMVEQARLFTITGPETYAYVAEFLKGIKALRERIGTTLDPHIKRAYDAHRELCAEKRRAEASAIEAERIAKDLLVAWDTEQERIAEAQRQQVQAAVDEVTLQQACEMAAGGDLENAEALIDMAPTAAVQKATPKISGVNFTERWSAKVTDLGLLVKHVAANPSLLPLLLPNMVALNMQAKSLKRQMQIPGVQAVSTKDVSAGVR